MQKATPETVRGDFGPSTFSKDGETLTFLRVSDEYRVRVEAGGQSTEYPVRYVFGHDPLEQYLLDVGDGRLQSLTVGWDTRSRESGGGRWFTLYPDEAVPPGDALHWLGPQQTWNHMCADCHSTGLRKNYRPEGHRFETSFAELDVSCESCHGAGSRHVKWARAGASAAVVDRGLGVDFRDSGAWTFADGQPTAVRTIPLASPAEVETCGRCHSRRLAVVESPPTGESLAQTHRVALLEPHLYFPDGQIEDEVFVYGSFLQSKMHAAGVRCTDCHDPHTGKLNAEGNALCARCHDPRVFDTPQHHHHPAGTPGASCVECHMPERTYMVIDPRRDHSMRIPRPDLSRELGTPNVCVGCHPNETNTWAAETVTRWYGGATEQRPHFAAALHAGESGAGERELTALIDDLEMPAIARATAISLLPRPLTVSSTAAIVRSAKDSDPLVRRAVAEALTRLAPDRAADLGRALLRDPVRTVRLAAVTSLAALPTDAWGDDLGQVFATALAETRTALTLHLDRAEICHNFGNLELSLGQVDRAESLFRRALERDPSFVSARVNLADVLRARGDDRASLIELRRAFAAAPESPEIEHALGLACVRTKDLPSALHHLGEAARKRPEEVRYAFVYGVALYDCGDPDRAIEVLKAAAARHPSDVSVRRALVHYLEQEGRAEEARRWLRSEG